MKGKIFERVTSIITGGSLGYGFHYVLKETYTYFHEFIKSLYKQANLNYTYKPYPESLAIPFIVAFGSLGLYLYEKYLNKGGGKE